ncbi:MAG: SEL1-like repeat protein [Francisella sp.]
MLFKLRYFMSDMSDFENIPNEPKKIGLITLTKKNVIKILAVVIITSICIIGTYGYISYKNKLILENYNQAITDIQNKNEKGYKNAFTTLQKLVTDKKATPKDLFYLGYLYQNGFGTTRNYYKAYKMYKQAANSNYPPALYQIAMLYKNGQGVNRNQKKAVEYLKKAYSFGYKDSIKDIAELIRNNNHITSVIEPAILYEIYLEYKNGSIKADDENLANKYLIAAAAEDYEPAIIVQAQDFEKAGDTSKAMMLWQKLLYSSNPKVSDLAKKEIIKIQEHLKQQQLQIQEQKRKKQIDLDQRLDKINQMKKIGLSNPKQKFNNLNGLIYINLAKSNKKQLQKFYKDITGQDIDLKLIKSSNLYNRHINKFLDLSNLKHNYSSLKFDFGNNVSNNKFEGINYYYFNNENKIIQDMVQSIIKNIKPKASSLFPQIYDKQEEQNDTLNKSTNNQKSSAEDKGKKTKAKNKKQEKNNLIYEEQMQKMMVLALKGDFKEQYKLEQAAKNNDVYAIYYTGEFYYKLEEYKKALNYFNKAAEMGYGPAYYKLASLYYNEENNGVPFDKEKAIYYYQKAAEKGVRNAKHILMLIK